MIGNIYTITNKDGDQIKINDHVTNPDQVIALQAYPQFDVDIKNNEIDKEGQHGIWDFNSFFGKRVITFTGVIVGKTESDVETVKNKLIEVLAIPIQPNTTRNGFVSIKWTDALSESWQIEAKLMRNIQFNRSMKESFKLDFNFSVKTIDPFIYSQTLNNQIGIRGYIQQGATFPIGLPATIGQTAVNKLVLNNNGSVGVHTIIRIYGEDQGDITNPQIENLTTGAIFKLNTTIQGSAEYIEIDSNAGTVIDQDGNDLSGSIDGDSEFVLLEQGVNELLYSSDEDPLITLEAPTAAWSVKFRKAKI